MAKVVAAVTVAFAAGIDEDRLTIARSENNSENSPTSSFCSTGSDPLVTLLNRN